MLSEVRLRDIGVIADATVRLTPGFNVITGETGAGKTMLLTGLGLLLGNRADSGVVRSGSARASVDGVLTIPPGHPAAERVTEAGGEIDDDLILARTLGRDGRTRAYAGGRSVPVGVLAGVGDLLVAVHGQADQWRLRRPGAHRELLDESGGERVAGALAAYHTAYDRDVALSEALAALAKQARTRASDGDLLREGLALVEKVAPEPGEDRALRAEGERLEHVEQIRAALGKAHAALAGADEATATSAPGGLPVAEALAAARSALAMAARHDTAAASLESRVLEVGYLVADITADLAHLVAGLDADPVRLAVIHERRAELSALARRLDLSAQLDAGLSGVDAVLDWATDAGTRLADVDTLDERLAELRAEGERAREALDSAARELTAARTVAARDFAAAVSAELAQLAMGGASVTVSVTPLTPATSVTPATPESRATPLIDIPVRAEGRPPRSGADQVEIALADGDGPPRSIARFASGGELSRLMLAIEVVAARRAGSPGEGIRTFVFDEVDAGVGGAAALEVGKRLADLARTSQVVVVTHLAQVAAFADHHIVVHKDPSGAVTTSSVTVVEGEARRAELARMMGGDGTSTAGLAHAEDLLSQARSRHTSS